LLLTGLILLQRNKWKTKGMTKFRSVVFYGSMCLVIPGILFPTEIRIPFLDKRYFTQPEARDLIGQLLTNTYRAFDFRDESDIYDKLSISNQGVLLTEVYLQTKKSMEIQNQGGIQAKIKEVNLVDVETRESSGQELAYLCRWQVKGSVGHWGHVHNRTNQYQALIRVVPVEGVWKLAGLDIIEESRL